MARHVYDFRDGGRDPADLLGGKGADLARMTRLGLPVPPGATVTTEARRAFLGTGEEPEGLPAEVSRHRPCAPARFSMPGMTETVLDIGLNDASVLQAMDGLPVTVRLLDPPLHEFPPDRTDLAVRVRVAASETADG